MKLLMISNAFQPAWDWGGPVKSMWNLARGLARLGVNVTVVSTNAKQHGVVDVPYERIEEGVRIVTSNVQADGEYATINRYGISSCFGREILRHTRHADIVHINGFWGIGPMIGTIACAIWKKPYIVSTRGNLQVNAINDKKLKKQIAFKIGVRRLLEKADALHYTTQTEKKWSPKWAENIHSIIIPNPIEVRFKITGKNFKAKYGIEEDKLIIGSIGRIHKRKGFDILANALGCITRRDIIWVVIGADEGYKRELIKMVEEQHLETRVKIIGELTGEELDEAFAGIDILVLPAYGENFGNVVVEAAIQGTPSIVSDKTGLMEWIKENDTGIVLPLDISAWARTLCDLKKEDIFKRWDSDRLSRLASENYSIEAAANQMLVQYEEILLKYNK